MPLALRRLRAGVEQGLLLLRIVGRDDVPG
jgi:hypothetical protein